MRKTMEWARNHKPHTVAIAIIVIIIIAVLIAAATGAFAPQDRAGDSSIDKSNEEKKTVDVRLNVTADSGWDEDSTPAIAHITGDDVDIYHAVFPDAEGNKGTSTVALAEGDYTVSFISPISSGFDIYDTGAPIDITVDADAETEPTVECRMTRMTADQVTDEMLQDIIGQTRDAIENGDETLDGDTGTGILDKLGEGDVAQDQNASDDTDQEETDGEKEGEANDELDETTPPAASDNGNSNGSQTQAGGQSSNTGHSGSGTTGSGNSGGTSSQPTHTHTWVNHEATRQVWVSNWVDVPDYETQQVVVGNTYTFADGYSTTDINSAKAHAKELILLGKDSGYQTTPIYETQTVQTGSHKEDQGHYETETYVDYVYCSSCGARQ